MKESEPESDEEIEDVLDIVSGDKEVLTYGFYSQLRLHKDYCSNMQNRYRSLTSTWLLASFAGMGFLLSGHVGIELPFNALLGMLILCFCSSFGITLLWFLDVVLYQRLWLGVVVELAALEKTHHWLPRINANTLLIRKSKKYPVFQSYFYCGINAIYILISMLISIYYFSPTIIQALGLIIGGIILLLLIIYYMLKYSGELEVVTIESFK